MLLREFANTKSNRSVILLIYALGGISYIHTLGTNLANPQLETMLKHCVLFIWLSQQQPTLFVGRVTAIIPITALPAHTDPPHQQQLTYMPLMLPQPRIKFIHLAACAGMIGIIAKQAMALIQMFSVQNIKYFLIVLSGIAGIVIDELIWV